MARIILDFGSGNTCRNDWQYVKRMLDELKAVDTGKHEIIIKHQLFLQAGENIPLDRKIFEAAYIYAEQLGYKTTASVFDKESLDFLLQFDVPFVKIANRRELDWLIGEVPRRVPILVSLDKKAEGEYALYIRLTGEISQFDRYLCCVSNYPAKIKDYERTFKFWDLQQGISDHTTDFELWEKCQPKIIEWHYKLEDSTGLDAGPFARTPTQLAEVL
jgi:sialic acid synthase SpsE